jgi:hypothetical protein
MIRDILFVIWFFLPAGLANVAPIFAAKLPYLKTLTFPLDGYITFRGKRLLGEHKTLRGVISGILVGIFDRFPPGVPLYLHCPVEDVRLDRLCSHQSHHLRHTFCIGRFDRGRVQKFLQTPA